MHKALYAPGKKGIQYATRSEFGQDPKHLKAHLLCYDCEQRFNQFGEWEVLRWLAPKAKRFPLHDRLHVAMPCGEIPSYSVYNALDIGVAPEKFTYFALSVVWRRSIHEWVNFDGTLLRRWSLCDFGEQLRTYLVGDAKFPPDTAVIVIVCSDDHSRQFWYPPSTDVVSNCLGFEFLARGVYFRALMGYHLPKETPQVSCSAPYGRILYGHCREMTEQKLSILPAFQG